MFTKQTVFLLFIFLALNLIFNFPSQVFAGKVELTTYYPAPIGEYENLTTTQNVMAQGDVCAGAICLKKTGETLTSTINDLSDLQQTVADLQTQVVNLQAQIVALAEGSYSGSLPDLASILSRLGALEAGQTSGSVLPGTLCGFFDMSGTTVTVKCGDKTNCPTGYTKKAIAKISGDYYYSCVKNA